MVCHKIYTRVDYWIRLEDFFNKHADIIFSHGICPDCVAKLGEQMLPHQKNNGQSDSLPKLTVPRKDDSLKDMLTVVGQAIRDNNPLAADIEKIVNRYAKLLRRFNKIVSIGDSYQSQLREFNLRLELMAHTDPLTGIYNRGYFMELLSAELNRSSRHERVFSVLMLDIDHFKLVNDTHGHAAGDEALCSLTRVIQTFGLRESDFFARIGGEEFALCLPETDMHGAGEVAERVRLTLEKTAIILNGKELYITASIGVSEYKVNDTVDTLLQRADHTMYRAKKSGRNKVCLDV